MEISSTVDSMGPAQRGSSKAKLGSTFPHCYPTHDLTPFFSQTSEAGILILPEQTAVEARSLACECFSGRNIRLKRSSISQIE